MRPQVFTVASDADPSAVQLKPRITVFTRSYPPAFLKGGPARSLHALVESLGREFAFSVVTSATDDINSGTMQSVKPAQWSTFGRAAVWYQAGRAMPAWTTVKLLRATRPDVIYLNSLFDPSFSILPLLTARLLSRKVQVILAPRGELSRGAIALKRWKKRAFIASFRFLGLHRAVTWHASTCHEKEDIERVFGGRIRSHVAIDLRIGPIAAQAESCQNRPTQEEVPGSLIFFSRIVPKKNVVTAIKAMALVKSDSRLTIAGPIEDPRYWNRCLELIKNLPNPQLIKYGGIVPAQEVVEFLSRFDLLVFPTLGENFGHVVLESLAAGTPAIVGKDTPWRKLETSGAGWLCDPANPEEIAELIDRFLLLDTEARDCMRAAARKLALEVLNDPNAVSANRSMLMAHTSWVMSPRAM